MLEQRAEERARHARRERVAVAVSAAVVVALVAWRASMGMTSFDDAHYPVMSLLIAQGGRPFANELTMQSLGFVLAGPFAKLWTALFGMTGIVLALREFYVLVAAVAGYAVFRALRPSFGRVPAAVAAAAPLVASPYNIFGISYNTVAIVGFTLAVSFGFAAIRDGDVRAAFAAGAATAVASFSYPPMSIGALVFVVSYALVARNRRLILTLLAGGVAALAVLLGWLFWKASFADVARSLAYSRATWVGMRPARERIGMLWLAAKTVLGMHTLIPMWLLTLGATIPVLPRRARVACLALLPLAALAPGLFGLLHTHDSWRVYGAFVSASIILASLALAAPIAVRALADRHGPLERLLALAAPIGLVNFALVSLSTNSGYVRGVGCVGLAPLAMALIVGWGQAVEENVPRQVAAAAATAFAGVLVGMLFLLSFKELPPSQLDTRMTSGALAGILTTSERASFYESVEREVKPYVHPNDTVTADAYPIIYLLTGGRVDTNAVWPTPGVPESYTVDYYRRVGTKPDVAVVWRQCLHPKASEIPTLHPLTYFILSNYRQVATGARYTVYVRR